MAKQTLVPVIVTTEHRGVFFGYTSAKDFTKESIRLENARNCVYWSSSIKGFIGLAMSGPNSECKIGPRAPAITLQKVTSVVEVSEAAVKAWETAPWS